MAGPEPVGAGRQTHASKGAAARGRDRGGLPMRILQEFKEFAIKGNVVDMAVGIIIGGAFGTIVSSLVKDVIMPPIGVMLGGVDFSNIKIPLRAGAQGQE